MALLGIGGHQSHTTGTHDWLTPPEIIRALGPFDLDPCASIGQPWPTARVHYTVADDGLTRPWFGRVWLNPPYNDKVGGWLLRMKDHQDGIALIFARTETRPFFECVWGVASSIFFVKGRLHFHYPDGRRAKFNVGAPSVLIAYGDRNSQAIRASGISGYWVDLSKGRNR